MRAVSAILAGLTLAAGCMTAPFEFRAERAESYLRRHREMPAGRAEALRAGRVVEGMTREEVALCLGRPQVTSRAERDGQTLLVWKYQRRDRPKGELERSRMWNDPIPTARVEFNADGTVAACRLFTPPAAARAGSEPPESSAVLLAPVGSVGGEPSVMPPAAEVEESGGGFEGWPELVLNGVVVGAGAPYAIINRGEAAAGDVVEGVRVLRITARGVTLQREDAVRFLRAGESTRP